MILDLYYTEAGRRTEKELVWAGDGVQIWLQLLLHVFRLRERDVVVLDEPDVFLHPDLQRRLVWLLESLLVKQSRQRIHPRCSLKRRLSR